METAIMNRWNRIQSKLVRRSEEPHFHGLRHKGLSGTICEDLLIKELRRAIPALRFDRGVVKFVNPTIRGNELKAEDLSSQFDIIIYRGKPVYHSAANAVIYAGNVLGVIEVKKWAYAEMLLVIRRDLVGLAELFTKKTGHRIPSFFVAFRYHDGQRGLRSWNLVRRQLPTKYTFAFSGHYSRQEGQNLYPWMERWWKHFESYVYANQYERLVSAIQNLAKTRRRSVLGSSRGVGGF